MAASTLRIIGCLLSFTVPAGQAWAVDPRVWFDAAARYDLSGEGSAPLAFEWYRRAAAAGLPEAEFNVAVMLDSGRGVARNDREAASWYARAAAHGDRRAAYNAGQLYAKGEGVPRNAAMARAWFAASGLPAARERIAAGPVAGDGGRLTPPQPMAPEMDSRLGPREIEFVWTSSPQPEPVRFYVEAASLKGANPVTHFTAYSDVSSTLAPALPGGRYAWRVFTIAERSGHYLASGWTPFVVDPDQDAPPPVPRTPRTAASVEP